MSGSESQFIQRSKDDKYLSVVNSIHEKSGIQNENSDDGLTNLQHKYEILNAGSIIMQEDGKERSLLIPLFDNKTVSV